MAEGVVGRDAVGVAVAGQDAAGVAVADVADKTKQSKTGLSREEREEYKRREGRRQKTATIPNSHFPALALVDTHNASRFIPRTPYFSNLLLRPTLI
jgi:hypothetical protein